MTKRDVIIQALQGRRPPYVPWSFSFTQEARDRLIAYYGTGDLEDRLQNHIVTVADTYGFFTDIGAECVRDCFGVVWDRHIDKDIGNVRGQVLPEPTLRGFQFPDPHDPQLFADIASQLARYGDRFRVFNIGFSLYERAWTLRGMVDLMMDFLDHPRFVHELLNAIADYNIAVLREACKYDIDAIYFGDDWGQQHGLIMGYRTWREFIYPVLRRMYGAAHEQGKRVFIHSCGDVDELFDDLIGIGLNCFNPFQPEVMDVYALLPKYRGRLAFHGGMSTQRILPYGSVNDVQRESRRLIELGAEGGYIFAPAHAVEGDVPLENMLAFIETMLSQTGYAN
ncbi:MAG: uroporphyrinogen-III decarboxylase-like protein [Chloroflexi bacterium]|nr:uroporphyrinogen-III decarboxylase-like protein [Chloroflexota bacterium]MCL5274880.1 uroporphyrinogen-III decarboxylase-like protein [Chloroflexota bacterium]